MRINLHLKLLQKHVTWKAKEQVKKLLPDWQVTTEACADSPAGGLIKRADEWQPDLIVVGSEGRTALGGRLILGSVSQRVLYEARASVRVARGRTRVDDGPVRFVIGVDGSPNSYVAQNAVASRVWPRGSEARLVMVLDTVISVAPVATEPAIVKWFDVDNESDLISLSQLQEVAVDKLQHAGLNASVLFKKGNPKIALIEEAKSWSADSIFVGAKGMRGIDRLLLGSVSATVAARAHCSVEICRFS